MKCLTLLLLFAAASAAHAAPDAVVVSPSGQFKIVQRYDEGDKWTSRVLFKERGKKAVTLDRRGEVYPSVYYVAPGEQWIFRIQRMKSGDTMGILYFVQPDGKVFTVDPPFSDRAWQYYENRIAKKDKRELSRRRITFIGWETDAVVFALRGTSKDGDPAHDVLSDKLRYDFGTEKFSGFKKPYYGSLFPIHSPTVTGSASP